jgi:RNA polymerase sigma factor (sigma-70 family)
MTNPSSRTDDWGPPTSWTIVRRAGSPTMDATTHAAFRVLVERYSEPVRRSLLRHLRGSLRVEEAAQDFFTYLFDNAVLPRVDSDRGKFRCFMQGVVRNYARSWLRGNATGTEDVYAREVSFLPPEDDGADQLEESWWAACVLEKALTSLRRTNLAEFELLQLRYGLDGSGERSPTEIGRTLGKSANAVNQSMHRARGHLHEHLLSELRSLVETDEEFAAEQALFLERLCEARPGLFDRERVE